MPSSDGGLGTALVGEKLNINDVHVVVSKLLGEGMLRTYDQVEEKDGRRRFFCIFHVVVNGTYQLNWFHFFILYTF
jgi:hypothetical protein